MEPDTRYRLPNTAAEYVELVEEQSRLPSTIDSYTGQDYSNLVRFLKTAAIPRCLTPGSSELYRQGSESENFVWIYELEGDKSPIGVPFSGNSGFGVYDASKSNQLLFLSGYPSPHVLAELGCRYGIDPEFFSRHLSFWRSGANKTSPILPSTQRTIFQTAFSSIGEHENMSYESFASKRSSFASEMGKYLHKLAMGNGWKSFDSIVRRVHVHDDRYFSIEQMLTILITKNKRNPEKWVVAVWQDAGKDLSNSPSGPWLDSQHAPFNTHIWPVTIHQRDSPFLKPRLPRKESTSSIRWTASPPHGIPQTMSRVPTIYGRDTDTEELAHDPLCALTEVFRLIAASEAQFLEMCSLVLEKNIDGDFSQASTKQEATRVILVDLQKILERHSTRIAAIVEFLRNDDCLDVPRSDSDVTRTSIKFLHRDFEYLLQSIRDHISRCIHELNTMMSEISVNEARRGMDQTRRAFKFTVLAALYIPLSFTCSLFGMNFVQFNDIAHGVRAWMALTIPLFVLSLLFLSWNTETIAGMLKKTLRARNA